MYAVAGGIDHASASPGVRGRCPVCGGPVHAKCGQIVAWHWAHVARVDCDPWAEPDSEWHRAWQSYAPAQRREVVIGPHRADLLTADGWVVELQHSPISVAEIAERERFYRRMVWLFDAVAAYDQARLEVRQQSCGYVTFRWKHPRKTITACRARVLLDLGTSDLLSIRRVYVNGRCGGWGRLVPAERVRSWLASDAQVAS